MSEEKQAPLIQRLAEACDAVGGVEKKGRNETQRYAYVKAADVAKAIRHELFKRGIVILPNEQDPQFVEIPTNSGGKMTEIRLRTDFEITDGVTSITKSAWGIARDSGDKAIYKAKTGAIKYFLRGLGLIPDEKDDPEADETVDKEFNEKYEKDFDQRTQDQRLIGDYQIRAWQSGLKQAVRTESQIQAYFKKLGIAHIEDMPKAVFNDAIKWLQNPKIKDDLTEDLKDSVQAVAKKALNFPKLFAEAREKGVPEEDVKRWAYETFKIKSMTELTAGQFAEVAAWIGTLA